jgi:uncharacterized repeat protein (TIGR03833 family)
MKDSRVRTNVRLGQFVMIQKPGNKERLSGIIKEILTDEFSHPLGIRVLLENGAVGRIKEIIESKEKIEEKNQSDATIKNFMSDLEKERILKSSALSTLETQADNRKFQYAESNSEQSSEIDELESKIDDKRDELEIIQNKINIARKEFLDMNNSTNIENSFIDELTIDTKLKQDLGILERLLRKTIVNGFTDFSKGNSWWKQRIPKDVRQRALIRKNDSESDDHLQQTNEYDLIDYVDFGDYASIIIKGENWKDVFSTILPNGSQLQFEMKISELNKVRSHLYHNRKLSDLDKKRFEVYYTDIMKFLLQNENKISV